MPRPTSRIPQAGAAIADLRGLVSTVWFRFFEAMWNLIGADGNTLSISDLAVGGVAPAPQVHAGEGRIIANVQAVLNFPATAAGASSDLTVNIPNGAVIGDEVTLMVPGISVPAGGVFFAWISAANIATIRYTSGTGGDPGIGVFRLVVRRY